MTDLSQLSDAQLFALSQGGSPMTPPPVQPVESRPLPQLPGVNSYGRPFSPADYSKLSDADLLAAANNVDPHMSTAEDVGRSTVTGLEKAFTGLLGQAGDARNLEADAVNFTGRQIARAFGKNPDQQVYDPRAVAAADVLDPTMLAAHLAPTTRQLDAVEQNHLGPYHAPQTAAGRYALRIAEFSPAALGGEAALTRGGSVLLPALASQGLEDAAPDNLKPAASILGALVGGGAAGGVERLTRAPQAALGAAAEGLSGQQIAAAQQLRANAAARGLNLTLAEAVQQATNNGTGLGRLQRVVEGTKQGQALTAPYFAERPSQVQGAVTSLADLIAPATEQPGMVGQRANEAANTALNKARQVVNQVADPDYKAIVGQQMDPEQYATLSSNPSYARALSDLRSDPELGAGVAHLPDNDLSVINEVQKRLGVGAAQAAGTPLTPGDNHLAALRTNAKSLADTLAREASEAAYGGEYGRARDTVADLSRQYVDPLKAGPLGAISKTTQVGEQTGALYPASPAEGASNETGQAVRVLGATQPGVAEDLTRQHLTNSLNVAMKNLQGGQNQYAGAKLAVLLAGNPEQAAALHEGISALPGGGGRAEEMADLMEALKATGKRQPPGSMTAFNESDLKDLHIAPFAHAIGRIGDPLTWGAGIGDVLNRANYRRNVKGLAEMLMAPPEETAAVLEKAQRAAKSPSHPIASSLLLSHPGAQR